MSEVENTECLELHIDADDLARSLLESGLLDETDPKIAGLLAPQLPGPARTRSN
jgi:hypothetical protein